MVGKFTWFVCSVCLFVCSVLGVGMTELDHEMSLVEFWAWVGLSLWREVD